jgi:hypothetical protein
MILASIFFLVCFAADIRPLCIATIWIQRSLNSDPLFQFSNGGRVGYINANGKPVFPVGSVKASSLQESFGEFHDGLLLLSNYPNTEFMDISGSIVKFVNIDRASSFSDGLAAALDRITQKWGFINTKGEFVIPPTYEKSYVPYLRPFSDDRALIVMHGKYGFLDRTGAFAIEAKFLEAIPFQDGAARVVIEGPCRVSLPTCAFPGGDFVVPEDSVKLKTVPHCKYAFIDKTGRTMSDQRFDDAKDFSEGLAAVKINGKWGFIDKTGALIVKAVFDTAESYSDGVALISEKGLFGFIGHDGTYAIEPHFKYAESFVDGLALIGNGIFYRDDSSFWYVDHTGQRAISDSFLMATSFFKGLAHVKVNPPEGKTSLYLWAGQFAYIDRTGKRIFTYEDNPPWKSNEVGRPAANANLSVESPRALPRALPHPVLHQLPATWGALPKQSTGPSL